VMPVKTERIDGRNLARDCEPFARLPTLCLSPLHDCQLSASIR
jgi:hypothetical protein